MEDFGGAKFHCPHALAGGNYREDAGVLLNGVTCTVSIH